MTPTAPAWQASACILILTIVTLYIVAISSVETLPFTDMPFRMAAAVIAAGDDTPPGPGLTEIRAHYTPTLTAATPTSLFIRFAGTMGPAYVPVLTKAWLAACVAGPPLVTLLILRRFGAHPISAAPVTLLLFNFNVAWGLLEFAGALVLVLVVVLALIHYEQTQRRRALVVVSATLVALFWCHLLALLFALALATATLCRGTRAHGRLAALAVAVGPAAAIVAAWALWADSSSGLLGETARYYLHDFVPRLATKKGLVINDNRHLFPGRWGTGFAAGVSAALVVSWVTAVRATPRERLRQWRARAGTRPLAWLLAGALACSLLLPDVLPGEPSIAERFGVFVFIAITLVAGVERGPAVTRAFALVVVCGVVLYAGLRVQYVAAFARDAAGLREAFAAVPAGEILHGIPYDATFRTHPAYAHVQDYRMAWSLGPSVSQLAAFRFYPVAGTTRRFVHRPFPHARSHDAGGLAACVLTSGTPPAAIAAVLAPRHQTVSGRYTVWCR